MLEEKQTSDTGTVEDNTQDYLEAIKTLKENSVDKDKYDQLRLENKRLLDSIVNGTDIGMNQPQEKKSIEELREAYLKEDQSNLEYIKNALALREALMEDGEPDPFLPIGQKILPTDSDVECANRVAKVLQECVDDADGDSAWFTNELQRRMIDIPLPGRSTNSKKK
ncbi:MAG: hypothetical protein J6S67_23840 [Methanobrevibacter sp.]|nr:hypothetical protein [Methanobrevibacter sp.]